MANLNKWSGFRANLKGKQLQLQLGFSHDVLYDIPDGISIKVDKLQQKSLEKLIKN